MIFHVHFDLVRESDDDFCARSDLHRVWNLHGGMNIIAFIVQSIITISRSVLCSYCMHVSVDVVTLKIHTMCFSLIYNICTYAWLPIINLLKLKNFILGCCFHLLEIEISVHYSICCVFQWNRHVLNERILDASACSWRTNISKSLESSIDAWAKWMELIFLELTRVLDASFQLSDSSLISIYFSLFLFSLGQTNMSIRGRILT